MVLSTLHTNDAPSTINRLLNMGIEPFLVASSVNAVVAQRLARRICAECKIESEDFNKEQYVAAGLSAAEVASFVPMKGKGCGNCAETGFKGRVALYEVMLMGETLKEFVLNGASALEIKKEAVRQGMLTLRRSALNKLLLGVTTLDEVLSTSASDR
jgi:type IV pilus assembly protein PilB